VINTVSVDDRLCRCTQHTNPTHVVLGQETCERKCTGAEDKQAGATKGCLFSGFCHPTPVPFGFIDGDESKKRDLCY